VCAAKLVRVVLFDECGAILVYATII